MNARRPFRHTAPGHARPAGGRVPVNEVMGLLCGRWDVAETGAHAASRTEEPPMSLTAARAQSATDHAVRQIEQRVLWLATAMVHHANRVRPNPTGLKVGGHQASSASMVTIMTSLWLEQLRPDDRVSVKPHASPVLHALEYLLGTLDPKYLTTLREFGGLQSYPSRLKDPVPADYSTGSVGIGATPPGPAPGPRPPTRPPGSVAARPPPSGALSPPAT